MVNATVKDLDPGGLWPRRVFEFTPLFRGNAAFGYRPWNADQSIELVKIAAISGAAQPILA